ncbi:MAG TPA: RNA polymerase factor sigma-54 [Candidatus Brocadiia bacterium]|nr:RNA polymerase factor sigma-54 [Candidatus Brocadiia bacterium]
MKLEAGLQQRMEQRLTLAPQIIQSIEILQLPLMELQGKVQQELIENPILEETPSAPSAEASAEASVGAVADGADAAPGKTERQDDSADAKRESLRDMVDYWDSVSQLQGGYRRSEAPEKDAKLEAFENTPAPPETLREHLIKQLALLRLKQEVLCAAENIAANLDERGYLAYPLEEIIAAMETPVSPEVGEEALRIIQSLEPRGVGARNLGECLLIQLDVELPDYELCRRIIAGHLDDLMQNRLPKVAKDLDVDIDTLKSSLETISRLNPRPSSSFISGEVQYISPDVAVEEVDGKFEVMVQDASLPRLGFCAHYLKQLSRPDLDERTRAYMQKKFESAKHLIEAIEQRRMTLQKVSTTIVEHQEDFLRKGIRHLKPLKMQEVADVVGVHVSTVSRAISNKYVQTPQGVLPLRQFFTGGTQNADGGVESWDAIRDKLQGIIDKEDKANPLSDDEIADMLSSGGLEVARRTIAKYRKIMNIPSSRQRKRY